MAVQKTFPQWLSFALNDPDKQKLDMTPASCVALSLVHLTGQVEKEIHGMKLGGKRYDDQGVLDLAETLRGIAETDAQNLPGVQQYVVYAFYEDQPGPGARYALRVQGHVFNSPGELSTEAPTPQGLMSARMRTEEGLHQAYMAMMGNLVNQQNQFLHLQGQRLAETMRENRDMLEFTRMAMIERVTDSRDHDMKMAQYQRTTEMVGGLLKNAPALVNTLTGKEVFPMSAVDTQIVTAVAEGAGQATPEEIAILAKFLPPELQGVTMQRISQIQQEKAAKDASTKALMQGNTAEMAKSELGT